MHKVYLGGRMSSIPRQLGAILDLLGFEWSTLFDGNKEEAGEKRNKVMAWLYRILDTLDSKTSHILGFTALLLATSTFLVGLLVANKQTPPTISLIALCLLLLPLTTGIFALRVFRVSWLFLGHIRPRTDVIGTEDRIRNELEDLARVCDTRARANAVSFILCCISAAGFFTILAFALSVVLKSGVRNDQFRL
jgi:hypothetical protein